MPAGRNPWPPQLLRQNAVFTAEPVGTLIKLTRPVLATLALADEDIHPHFVHADIAAPQSGILVASDADHCRKIVQPRRCLAGGSLAPVRRCFFNIEMCSAVRPWPAIWPFWATPRCGNACLAFERGRRRTLPEEQVDSHGTARLENVKRRKS